MTTGLSGSYAIQGTDLTLQPTTGRWLSKDALGLDGAGHPILPAIKNFEVNFQLMSISDFNQLYTFFLSVSNTGTVAVDLPQFSASDYRFHRYSGCILHEPSVGDYFVEHVTDVRLLVTNIRT